jgi:hypothetical protein
MTSAEEVTVENAKAITGLTAQPVLRFSPDRRLATGTNWPPSGTVPSAFLF